MAEKTFIIKQQLKNPIKIIKWKVKEGATVAIGRILMLYEFDTVPKKEQQKFKSTKAGTIRRLCSKEGDIVNPDEPLLEVEACIHSTVMKDMCAECGADLRKDDSTTAASVPMVHSVPELKVSQEVAQKIGRADGERLLRDRKLVLLVDLDQTLIHTTNDNIPATLRDVYHFQLYGKNSAWYHTRLRPGTHEFLSNIAPFFELHICTFGARNYAHKIAMFLDADGKYFSHRILSRDDCFYPTSKTANLKALFPCGDNMVCIIDDREDVWSYATNLIHVKPYHFFNHTGDINAPPGLDKHEHDRTICNGVKDKCAREMPEKRTKEPSKEMPALSGTVSGSGNKRWIKKPKKREENFEGGKTIQFFFIPKKAVTEKKENSLSEHLEQSKEENNIELIAVNAKETSAKEKVIEEKTNITQEDNEEPTDESKEDKKEEIASNKQSNCAETEEKESMEADKKDSINEAEKESSKEAKTEDASLPTAAENVALQQLLNSLKPQQLFKSFVLLQQPPSTVFEEEFIVTEDPDNYLFYLEDILKSIHKAFYDMYDRMESGEVPDLKKVIPSVRKKVLLGTKLVFSGLVATHVKLEQSKAYQVARSLGAEVCQDLEAGVTHLVAVRPGTAKVNAGRRKKNLHIVTPDWLWACAECWLKVEEKLYPLSSQGSRNRHPPPHCGSPELLAPNAIAGEAGGSPGPRKRTASGRFMDTINPLMSFSSADIEDMDREVEDIFNESDESDSETNTASQARKEMDESQQILSQLSKLSSENSDDESSSSSSIESLTAELPRGFKRGRRTPGEDAKGPADEEDLLTENNSLDECPSAKFRRGEKLESDLDFGQDSNSDGSMEPEDEVDDGDWNMMGAALEREFLANN